VDAWYVLLRCEVVRSKLGHDRESPWEVRVYTCSGGSEVSIVALLNLGGSATVTRRLGLVSALEDSAASTIGHGRLQRWIGDQATHSFVRIVGNKTTTHGSYI
jgi:hypothetical protein